MNRSLNFLILFVVLITRGEIEIPQNEVTPKIEEYTSNCPLIENLKTSGSISAIKKSLASSETIAGLIQEFLNKAKFEVNELEKRHRIPGISDSTRISSDRKCNNGGNEDNRVAPKDSVEDPSTRSVASSCYDLQQRFGFNTNGIYRIRPRYLNRSVNVFCDMSTTTGGWTVIQRRADMNGNQENFFRNWHDYKTGFGILDGEFWIGNDVIFALSNESPTVLRVDLEDFEGAKRFAHYNIFHVSTETSSYKLKVDEYSGDAGDSLSYHNGSIFHTYDRTVNSECVQKYKGGWWYLTCHESNLNGLYLRGNHTSFAEGVNWKHLKGYHYSFKTVEMKIRPSK